MDKILKDKIRSHIPGFVLNAKNFLFTICRRIFRKTVNSFDYIFARIHIDNGSAVKEVMAEYWKDYSKDMNPLDRRMRVLEERGVEGMSTENIRFLMNELVRRFATGGTYLEVGTYKGCSLLSAALFNPSARCIGIDNFCMFSTGLSSRTAFKQNLEKFGNLKNVEFREGDYRECIRELFLKEPGLKVNVYYYDGKHSYANQLEGLRIMKPFLAQKCIIFIDDVNLYRVRRANMDFLKENPDFRSVFKVRTRGNHSNDWWNGFEVITRGI